MTAHANLMTRAPLRCSKRPASFAASTPRSCPAMSVENACQPAWVKACTRSPSHRQMTAPPPPPPVSFAPNAPDARASATISSSSSCETQTLQQCMIGVHQRPERGISPGANCGFRRELTRPSISLEQGLAPLRADLPALAGPRTVFCVFSRSAAERHHQGNRAPGDQRPHRATAPEGNETAVRHHRVVDAGKGKPSRSKARAAARRYPQAIARRIPPRRGRSATLKAAEPPSPDPDRQVGAHRRVQSADPPVSSAARHRLDWHRTSLLPGRRQQRPGARTRRRA